jgi:heme exporter protein C
MKAVIIVSGVLLGVLFGFYNGIAKPKPVYWKAIAIIIPIITIFLTILPPIAGTFSDAAFMGQKINDKPVNVKLVPIVGSERYKPELKSWRIKVFDAHYGNDKVYDLYIKSGTIPNEFKRNYIIVAALVYDRNNERFIYKKTVSVNPWFTLPYVPSLGELVRVLNYHVPSAWIAVLGYLISMVFAIQYLRKRELKYDIMASSAAELGTVYCLLALVTGMIWAKFNWGSFWNWDPRETSILVLLLIYFAYFALRSAIEKEELKARLSAVYSIIAFVTVPFFVFVVPRITNSLHPGSRSEGNIGPVLSSQSDMLNTTKQYIFSLSLMSFSIVFLWLLNLRIRIGLLKARSE